MNQGYGHIGRPTNEEVKSKKRKAALKVLIPVVAVVALVGVVAGGNFNGMKGDSVTNCTYECEEGYQLDDDKCYKTIDEKRSEEKAYLVGDVINEDGEETPDGKVTTQDRALINKVIDDHKDLTEEQKLVYDINGDGEVNSADIDSYVTTPTGELSGDVKYVCPKNKVEIKKESSMTYNYTYDYSLQQKNDNYYCLTTITQKEMKEATKKCGIDDNKNE